MNMQGGSWTAPEPVPGGRASDADRDVVVARLREAIGEGIIDLTELEERLGATYAAKSKTELAAITADLPSPARPVPPARPGGMFRSALKNASFRMHATVYGATNGMLVGIWAMSGAGEFWPFYPAAGWGIGLTAHAAVASAVTEHRDRRARRERDSSRRQDRHARQAERLARHVERKGLPPQAAADVQRAIEHAQRAYAQARQTLTERLPEDMPLPPKVREMLGNVGVEPPPRPSTPPTPSGPAAPPASTPPAAPTSRPAASGATSGAGNGVQRRFVVALFIDVVGSTQLNEAMGDAGWVRIRTKLREMLTACFQEHGGWEANSSGDGVLARFDQPDAAIRAAIEVLRRLDRQRDETGFAPSVRIGIHSGDAVEEGQDIIGTVVNLAARVMAAAEPDEIIVTEHVADHAGPNIRTEGRGLHTLKGLNQPRHLLAVDWR